MPSIWMPIPTGHNATIVGLRIDLQTIKLLTYEGNL